MSLRVIPAVIAALLFPIPGLAQEPPPPVAASAPAAPTDAEVTAAVQAFRTRIETMNAELGAAVQAAGSNRRRATASVEAILVRNEPEIEAFAVLLEAHFAARAAAAPTEEARASVAQTAAAAVIRIRGMPGQVRAGMSQTASSPAQTTQPTSTQPSTGY